MREFIIADNQDITKAGMMFLLGRQKDTSLLLEADNKAELIQQLRLHPTAVVILDYTLFDFSGAEELMVLHERFKEADWLLFSDELSLPFLRQVLFSSMAFGVALKDNSKEEILTHYNAPHARSDSSVITSVTCCSQATVPPPPLILPSKMIY